MESLEAELARARELDVSDLADAIESIGFECTRCGGCCTGYAPDEAGGAPLALLSLAAIVGYLASPDPAMNRMWRYGIRTGLRLRHQLIERVQNACCRTNRRRRLVSDIAPVTDLD